MSVKTVFFFTLLTGGTAAALDSVDGNSLVDGDVAIVLAGGYFYAYLLDADSGAAESSPSVISPDTNAGTKRWINQSVAAVVAGLTFADLGTGFSLAGGTTPKTISIINNVTLPGMDYSNTTPVDGVDTVDIRFKVTRVAGDSIGWTRLPDGTYRDWGLINV